MNNTPVKLGLIELMRRAREEERKMVAGLSEAERVATGTPDRLAAKDLVAHVSAARARQAQKLTAAARGENAPGFDDHQDAQIFAEYQNRSWQEIEDEADRVFAELGAQVEALTEEQLTAVQPHPCEDEQALWRQLVFPGVWHPYAHLTGFYLERNNAEAAMRMQEELVDAVRGMAVPEPMRAHAIYNLACLYAVTGRPHRALKLLPEALRLDPWLVEFSKHDADLETLRNDPAFQALYAA